MIGNYEAIISEKNTDDHFSKIAPKYMSLRTTDFDHIQHIKNRLSKKLRIKIADIGCGDGRYSLELLKCLKDDCYMHCIDYNENMLKHLKSYLVNNGISNFCTRPGNASKLPLENNSMDCIVTFNAIHHFDIQKFLSEVHECLKDNGIAFIYTRLRDQNSRNIWGRHFPLFAETENRLFEFDELKYAVKKADMRISNTRVFGHDRTSDLSSLVKKAKSNHYSTFALYDKDEFKSSSETFEQNIRDNFDDLDDIRWQDENILLEIGKD
ncbi:class I SAM-dependent methyltransferase [archaeon]|nr:class I SAM-dependent methyltransferase [archaeon]